MIEYHSYDPMPLSVAAGDAGVSMQPNAVASALLSGPPAAKAKAKSKARAKPKPRPTPVCAHVMGRKIQKIYDRPKPKSLRSELQPTGNRMKVVGFAPDCSTQHVELPIAKHVDQFFVDFRLSNRAYHSMASSPKFQPTVGYWRLLI